MYICDKWRIMKKATKRHRPNIKPNLPQEPAAVYRIGASDRAEMAVTDFTYLDFKKIVNKGPFTLADWAAMLFVSERTLHRYAKEGGGFNGLHIERILHLETLIDMGNDLFGGDGFKIWLQSRPFSLGGDVAKSKLVSHSGIQDVIDMMGRLQHGISA